MKSRILSSAFLSVFSFGLLAMNWVGVSAPYASAAAGVDITVTKTDGKTNILPGQTNTYSITVANQGTLAADYAYIYDALPAAYDPTTSVLSCADCYYLEGSGTAELYAEMTLLPGKNATLTISAKLKSTAKGTVNNTVQSGAWAPATDVNVANNNATDTTVITTGTPLPTPSPTAIVTPSPTPVPTPTATPAPTPTATSTATPAPTLVPTPTATPTASPSPTVTPTPSSVPTTSPAPSPTPQASSLDRAIWFYHRTLPIGQNTINDTLAKAQQYGFNVIYYTVEDYAGFAATNNQTKITQMRDALRKLVSQANAKGIRVDALAGENNWGEQAGYKDALATADFIIDYNRTAQENEKVRSLQFDVEPHTLSTYEKNKAPILTRYVGMLDAVAQRIKDSTVAVGFDVVAPHWLDSVRNWTPKIPYNGKTQYTYNHILDLLQKVQSSKYIIMDYANVTGGTNGSIEQARPEIEQASAANSKTKVVIAHETGNYPPVSVISFYGMCRSKLEDSFATLKVRFQNESSFGGFAVNSYETYLALKDC